MDVGTKVGPFVPCDEKPVEIVARKLEGCSLEESLGLYSGDEIGSSIGMLGGNIVVKLKVILTGSVTGNRWWS